MSDRYSRQIMIPEFGEDGQEKLHDASVLVIGAGGLGTSLIYHLAAAGVGTIGIADNDIVSLSNLNRQFIHFEDDIGSLKVVSAAEKSVNSTVAFRLFHLQLPFQKIMQQRSSVSMIS